MQIVTIILILLGLSSCSASKNSSSQIVRKAVVPAQKMNSGVIVLDPGHGGEDPGARSKIPPFLVEKSLNLYTAKEVASLLRAKGYKVELTRTGDHTVGLHDRVYFAEKRGADLFVSIHFNACSKPEVRGIEVYYFKNRTSNPREVESKKLAKQVLDEVVRYTHSPSRGVRPGNLCVVRETKMPAILVECGFLTSPRETSQLKSRRYLQQIAKGIASGVNLYYTQTGTSN